MRKYDDECCEVQPARQMGQVERELGELSSAILSTETILDDLVKRLEGVLNHNQSELDNQQKDGIDKQIVPIACAIRNDVRRVDNINCRLMDIIECLEL